MRAPAARIARSSVTQRPDRSHVGRQARPSHPRHAAGRAAHPARGGAAGGSRRAGPGAAAGAGEAPAYRQLAADLRQAAVAGHYPPGQRLPTEAELVASTGLSRQTVRRASRNWSPKASSTGSAAGARSRSRVTAGTCARSAASMI